MVTVIGLPLLIVNGKFQSLGTMTIEDLETFIPFLTKCSVNRAGARLHNGVPEWWSSTIQYKFPLKKPRGLSQIGYRRHLSAIVCSCYWYHDAQYLLPFCAKIADSPQSVFLQNNADNTTSIFSVQNTSHMLKFNNENKNYDRNAKKGKPRPSLLSALPKKSTVIPDIYLCENCDAEFSSHPEMQKHEKECFKINDVTNKHKCGNGSSSGDVGSIRKISERDSSEEIEILGYIKPNIDPSVGKNKFFSNLMMQPKNTDGIRGLPKLNTKLLKLNMGPRYRRWVDLDWRLYKNGNIEFSSLLGRKVLANTLKHNLMNKIHRTCKVNDYECYCNSSGTSRTYRDQKGAVDFKVTSRKTKKNIWVHQYSFNKEQKKSKYLTLVTGLNEHSRKLLKQCKRLQIILKRLEIPS